MTMTVGSIASAAINVRTVSVANQKVQCTWSAGTSNGFPISGYQVSFRNSLGQFTRSESYCEENAAIVVRDGSASTVTNTVCTVTES